MTSGVACRRSRRSPTRSLAANGWRDAPGRGLGLDHGREGIPALWRGSPKGPGHPGGGPDCVRSSVLSLTATLLGRAAHAAASRGPVAELAGNPPRDARLNETSFAGLTRAEGGCDGTL